MGQCLEQRWNTLTCNSCHSWWSEINGHYTSKGRFYHNLRHIQAMFELFDEYSYSLQDKDAVAFAIFFHDIIYDPKRADNELRSADLFLKFAESSFLKLSEKFKTKVYDWIDATKNHSEHVNATSDRDLQFFLDFDLEVLSWPEEKYQLYSEQIRQEYIHVAEDMYGKRAEVLKGFLQQEHLYATEEFRLRCEDQARHNLLTEIRRLEGT